LNLKIKMRSSKYTSLFTLFTYAPLTLAAPRSAPPNATTSPDYVIVGGGPAGFVLAEQLSQDPTVNVVLLEAGPDTAGVEAIDVPGYAPSLLQTPYTWNYTCQPDPNLEGASPMLHQGRGFGGGSAVNYLGHCRGAPSVFNDWAKISGDDGLNWKNFQNDFKATVHYKETPLDYDPHVNKNAYGNGPIELTAPNDDLGFVMNLIKSWTNVLKLPWVDLNDGTGLGISSSTNVIRANNRTRDYAPQAYGWQLAGRKNAQQLHNAEVTKIGFKGKRAVSVTFVDPTTNVVTTLTPKEIIITAGALNSPKVRRQSKV
jgi:choline dehydrogenase